MQDKELEKEIIRNTQVLSGCDWVKEEFASSDFEDKRLFLRMLVVAKDLSKSPMASINQASEGWKVTKAAYRFFDNAKVTKDSILKSHIKKTQSRIGNHTGTILAIQDTTFLNYSHMKSATDLGPIGRNTTSTSLGLVMHTVFAVTAKGLPLGFLHQDIWARDKEVTGLSATRHLKKIEEKESYKWLKAIYEQSKVLPANKNVIAVCDREADIYEFFNHANKLGVKVIVRATHNRCLEDGEKLWDSLEKEKVKFSYKLQLHNFKNDVATLQVRYAPVSFALNSHKKNYDNSPKVIKNIMAVYITEKNPPHHREPLTWMLLANFKISSHKAAENIIKYYSQRWKIEVLHRIMKSGCNIELTRLLTNERRIPFVALKSIVAWRLMLISHYNKISPNDNALSILTRSECDALYIAKHKKIAINQNFSAKKAITWIAELGGYLSRKADPTPGPTHVWRGWQRLQDLTNMYDIIKPH